MTGGTSTPHVVYAGFATARHSGGVQVQADHVRLLGAAGVRASLWVPDAGSPGSGRPSWLAADVPLIHGRSYDFGAPDLLVLPEVPIVADRDPAPGVRKVIFNQNHFYTFVAWPPSGGEYPGWDPAPAVWTVSAEAAQVLQAVHPALPVTVVPPPVDTTLFAPAAAKYGIAWLPKKRPGEAELIRRALAESGRIPAASVRELADVTHPQVAQAFAAAAVVIALSHSDGFGLPVAEAMAAECLVVGYDGGGGAGLFEAPGVWRVPEQRPLLLVDQALTLAEHAGELAHAARANREWVSERHSDDVVSRALLAAVRDALQRPGSSGRATHPAAWLDRLPPEFTKRA